MNLVNPSLLVQNPKIKPVYQVEETYKYVQHSKVFHYSAS